MTTALSKDTATPDTAPWADTVAAPLAAPVSTPAADRANNPLAEPANNSVPNTAPTVAKSVRVKLIWPAARGAKIDCQGNTKIIWTGNGDVQDYPADKWHLLESHPDVWELVNEADAQVAKQAFVDRVETPEARLQRLQDELKEATAAVHTKHEADRLAAERAKTLAAGLDTDAVVVTTAPEAARSRYRVPDQFDPPATPVPATPLTEADLAELSDEDVRAEGVKRGYTLHPRLNSTNLRLHFLAQQAQEAQAHAIGTTG